MAEFPETSQSLIARVKDLADEAAWNEFFAIYEPVVLRMAQRRGMQEADANDVAQQVFLSVSHSIGGWRPGIGQPPFRAWLVTITRNAVTKALMRRKPDVGTGATSVIEVLESLCVDDRQTTHEFDREGRTEAMRWGVGQIRSEFSVMTWRLFWETVVMGRSVADVAQETERSAGAVYMARFKVLQRLKEKIQEFSRP
jgi:RNA polymerase sigma-70 factor (ECF subfamily)